MPAGNLPHALEYIKRGWKIFPLFYIRKDGSCSCKKVGCKRAGKHPITRNGLQDASSDESSILQWWTESPYANIGLATGHGGLIVMDVDCSGAKVGLASLQLLVGSNSPMPATLTVQTGSGGAHYYFLSTKDIKNSAGLLGADLDVRGHGGYVILPPSNHMSGGKYQWSVDIGTPIADMPEWMEALCAKKSVIDVAQDIDEKQTAEIQKSLPKDKFSAEQLIKLLEYIPADCERDVWWKVGAALKKELGEKRGWEVWDAWSQKAPDKYDAKAAFTHWQSLVDKGITGGTIYKFAKDNGFRGFDAEAADRPELRDRWLYAVSIKRFIETNRLIEWDAEQFNANFAPLFERGKPADHLLKNPSFKRVDGITYWPKQEQFVEEGGQYKLNYWKPSGVIGLAGEVSPFLEHVNYLFPEEEAGILLDYLAFQVQHPGEKVHWAILLEGDQGTGKSYFATVMRLVLGESNVKMVNNEQLHETFTAWQRNTQLIVVEEMMARQRLELMNKLKPMVTEPWCTIREMYRPPYEQPNRFNFLFFSNHKDSLIIDNTDRRYCILKSLALPHPEANAYYGPLFDWTRRNAGALLHYLANRSLGNFKPKAHAPMTAGKRALIEQSMLPLDQFIYDQVETKEYPCQWDLLNASVMVKPLSDHNLRVNPKEITNAFSRLGYQNLGRVHAAGEERVVMWAVRNFETYRNMTVTQLRQVWLMQVNGTPREPGPDVVDAIYKDRAGDALKKKEPM